MHTSLSESRIQANAAAAADRKIKTDDDDDGLVN